MEAAVQFHPHSTSPKTVYPVLGMKTAGEFDHCRTLWGECGDSHSSHANTLPKQHRLAYHYFANFAPLN